MKGQERYRLRRKGKKRLPVGKKYDFIKRGKRKSEGGEIGKRGHVSVKNKKNKKKKKGKKKQRGDTVASLVFEVSNRKTGSATTRSSASVGSVSPGFPRSGRERDRERVL